MRKRHVGLTTHSRHGWLDKFNSKFVWVTSDLALITNPMILCADDYGLRGDINRAILDLSGSGRLSAVSCMVAFEQCTAAVLSKLLAYQDRIDIGLHVCLTHEQPDFCSARGGNRGPASFPPYAELVRRALTRRVQRRDVARQVSAQYELFVKKCGRRPDHIDGHLYVHQLPGVRAGLLDFLSSLPAGSGPYVRNTRLAVRDLWRRRLPWVKSAFIGAFGNWMSRRLRALGVPTNTGFAGIYDFRDWNRYPEYFPRFMSCLEHANGLLVVHPGQDEDWRRQELAVLGQFPFPPGRLNRFQRS
jgi:hypothetical protein